MMTRLEYIDRKMSIEQRMKQTRKALDDARIEQDRREFQEYLERKHRRAAECKEQCAAITEHYKDIRRTLWTEDVELDEEWRARLRQDEVQITPLTTDGLTSGSPMGGLTKEEPNNE